MSDLGLNHRRSPISVTRTPGRLRAGDRLPDAEVLVQGRRLRLHQLLSFRHWTLILPPYADPGRIAPKLEDRAPIRIIRAAPADAQASRMLGGHRGMLLVRPDGYVGLSARSGDLGALDAYLAAWLPIGTDYSRENRVSWLVMNSSRAGTPA